METLIWMGILGVAGFMMLFWAAHKLYRKVRPAEGQVYRPGPSRGQHIFAGVVAGVATYMVLGLIFNQLPAGRVVRYALWLATLAVAAWAGVRVYRVLQRRGVKEEAEK